MFQVTAGTPAPIAAIMREVAGLRLQDRTTVITHYQATLEAAEQKRKEAKIAFEKANQDIKTQETEYTLNENLVEAALEACVAGDLDPIRFAKRRGGQTWELFCQSYPIQIALKLRHTAIFGFLLENNLDYRSKSPHHLPVYEDVLTLAARRSLTQKELELVKLMSNQILKDMLVASETGELLWFLDAIYFSEKLIHLPIPGKAGMTPLMQLARDNHLEALIKIDKDFKIEFSRQDELGRTVFDHAFECGHKELSLWLLQRAKPALLSLHRAEDLLIWALLKGEDEQVTHLLSTGVDVKARDNAALISACRFGTIKQVRALGLAGVEFTARKLLALSIAIQRREKKLIQYLLMQDCVYKAVMADQEIFEAQLKKAGFHQNIQKIRLGWLANLSLLGRAELMRNDADKHPGNDPRFMSLREIIEEMFSQMRDHDQVDILPGFPRFARPFSDTAVLNIPIAHQQDKVLELLGSEVRTSLEKGEARLDIQYTLKKGVGANLHFVYYFSIKCHYESGKIESLRNLAVVYQYEPCRLLFNLNIHVGDPKYKSKGIGLDLKVINQSEGLDLLISQLEALIRIGSTSLVIGVEGENDTRLSSISFYIQFARKIKEDFDLTAFTLDCYERRQGIPPSKPLLFNHSKLYVPNRKYSTNTVVSGNYFHV